MVYLSGRFLPYGQAAVPVEDRGFLFGDGIYEVFRVYRGRPFRFQDHLERLTRSAREIRLDLPDLDWAAITGELLERNGLKGGDATVYLQVTRGAAAPRTHWFPPPGTPATVLMLARPARPVDPELVESGATAITHPDERWGRCDIKSINLLPNVLAKQRAVEAGAHEALFVRDGVVLEGASSNLFAVLDGRLVTYPRGPRILAGVTRGVVLELARELGIPVVEGPILVSDLDRATELFITSTTAEILPVVRVDGRPIGDGRPGPVTRALYTAFRQQIS
nr:MAG: D-amino acid aminotransferase [Bacillota bacterium]